MDRGDWLVRLLLFSLLILAWLFIASIILRYLNGPAQ